MTFDADFGERIDLASLVQTDDAHSASASNTRAESCLSQDCVEEIGQSGLAYLFVAHDSYMRTSGYCGQRIRHTVIRSPGLDQATYLVASSMNFNSAV